MMTSVIEQSPFRRTILGATWFFVALLGVAGVRSIWTFPVFDPDALTKYFYAAEIIRTGNWGLLLYNHHTMRWVEMVPQVWLTEWLGFRFEVFYILPLLVWSASFLVVLRAVRSQFKTGALLLLAALLFVEPLGFRTSSQLLNPPFGVLFAGLGIFVLVEQGVRRNAAVALSATLFFLAYGAHVTYLAFAGGSLLWLWLIKREQGKAALFAGCIGCLLLLEALVFNGLSGWEYTFGRWEGLLSSAHVERAYQAGSEVTFRVLLSRWVHMPRFDQALVLAFGMSLAWLFWRQRWRRAPDFVVCSILAALAYGFFITFAVVDVDPLRPLVILRPRYLTPFFPFASVVLVYVLTVAPFLRDSGRSLTYGAIGAALLALLVLAPGWYNLPPDPLVVIRPVAFAWRAESEFGEFSQDFTTGRVVLSGGRVHANKLIPMFRSPVETVVSGRRISAVGARPDALCIDHLYQVPLTLNYHVCE